MVVHYYSRVVFILIFLILFIWIIIFQIPDSKFHLIACDVGQGDGILITYKDVQVITDGGLPNGKMERCLSKHLPFWDKHIEVVVNTHPQLDHFGGLVKVFENYEVDYFIKNDLKISTQEYKVLQNVVGSSGVKVVSPGSMPSIRLGLMHYDIFYPSEKVLSFFEGDNSPDPNDVSVQSLVKFGEFTALLTGDIGENMSSEVLKYFPNIQVNYIKIPHHGSKYGMVESYLRKFVPDIAVISSGKNNSYGHPTKEILKILNDKKIKVLRTDELGDVEIISDGKNFWQKT